MEDPLSKQQSDSKWGLNPSQERVWGNTSSSLLHMKIKEGKREAPSNLQDFVSYSCSNKTSFRSTQCMVLSLVYFLGLTISHDYYHMLLCWLNISSSFNVPHFISLDFHSLHHLDNSSLNSLQFVDVAMPTIPSGAWLWQNRLVYNFPSFGLSAYVNKFQSCICLFHSYCMSYC